MIQNLITAMIPALLRQVADISDEDKHAFAAFLGELCAAYRECDREGFITLLSQTSFPVDWKKALMYALWDKETLNERPG